QSLSEVIKTTVPSVHPSLQMLAVSLIQSESDFLTKIFFDWGQVSPSDVASHIWLFGFLFVIGFGSIFRLILWGFLSVWKYYDCLSDLGGHGSYIASQCPGGRGGEERCCEGQVCVQPCAVESD
uniref:Uncharacterized protein n=1 Tax=Physcomitrium patens TaxID=3218 RepID=A0A7I4ETU9_PHYPA